MADSKLSEATYLHVSFLRQVLNPRLQLYQPARHSPSPLRRQGRRLPHIPRRRLLHPPQIRRNVVVVPLNPKSLNPKAIEPKLFTTYPAEISLTFISGTDFRKYKFM